MSSHSVQIGLLEAIGIKLNKCGISSPEPSTLRVNIVALELNIVDGDGREWTNFDVTVAKSSPPSVALSVIDKYLPDLAQVGALCPFI